MKATNLDPNCLKQGTHKGRRELFAKNNLSLDHILRSLEAYMGTKRSAFPRFYFLSNDELLQILARTQDPTAVQPFLRKCFDNLVELRFGNEGGVMDIEAMISGEGEEVSLGRNLKARGNVEEWLLKVEERMKSQLHGLVKAGLLDYVTNADGSRGA